MKKINMSEQRRRRYQRTEEKIGLATVIEHEVATTSRSSEEIQRFSNVRCARSILEKEVRSPPLQPPPMTDKEIKILDYLDHNKDFLESYVLQNVPLRQLEGWLVKKLSNGSGRETATFEKPPLKNNNNDTDKTSQKQVFMETSVIRRTPTEQKPLGPSRETYDDLVKRLQTGTNEHSVLWELAGFICVSIGVNAYRVYKVFPDHPKFIQYFDNKHDSVEPIRLVRADITTVRNIAEVAKKGICWRMSRDEDPINFPDIPTALLLSFGQKNVKDANHVLYQPILSTSGKTVYVIEMLRIFKRFSERDEDITSNFIVWGSLLLNYCNLYLDKKRERNMSDFLLDVVKAIFEGMVSLDQLIKRILEFAQRLVNADRASLFLVDYRNFELVSTVFDLKFDPSQKRDMEKKEIRMPINRGIAGHVALSGETMNIPDAYSDYRFNREVDEATGYKTISILCMPVKVQGRVIGVVQMVNKRNENNFDHEDEVAFETFSTIFGLALHHARLYDKIIRKEQKYRVALEVLSYHNTCKEHEVKAILTEQINLNVNINNFYLDPYQLDSSDKCKFAVKMFDELFGLSKFDIMTLTRFVLTVKKNYRTVPYHNFDHGWSVAHAMYVILKSDTRKRFDYKTRLSLFVASLCHDLDHRGYTNKYMSETASPLAAMYTTSTLEHHHFNITVTILQQDGHNIFSHFSSEEYKDILRCIRQCILATDLAVFFPNLAKLTQICEGKSNHPTFNWEVPVHRDLAMALSMTAADLSASAKTWDIQLKTVKVIFEEFYDQGDRERAAGKTPIPMMDRNKPDQQPSSQVGFLSQICVPCYSMLYKILPNTKPMYLMSVKNLNNWKYRASQILAMSDIGCSSRIVEDSSLYQFDNSVTPEDGIFEVQEFSSESDDSEGSDEIEDFSSEEFGEDEEVIKKVHEWDELNAYAISWNDANTSDNNDSIEKDESFQEDDEEVVVATTRKDEKTTEKNEFE